MAAEAVKQLRAGLESSIVARLTSGSELIRSLERRRRNESLPTALPAIDTLLGGGLTRGKVTEMAGRGLRFSVVLATLAAATSSGEAATLIDVGDHFDPQLGEAAGIDLRRLLWVRPKTMKQAATAAELLAVSGFQLVVLDAGLPPLHGRVPDAGWVRLARTAETHGTALFLSTPYPLTGTTCEAMLTMGRPKARWLGGGAEPRLLAGFDVNVRLEKHRHKRPGEETTVTFHLLEAIPEERAEGRKERAEGRGPRAESREESAECPVPSAESRPPAAPATQDSERATRHAHSALGTRPSALSSRPSSLGPRPFPLP